MTVVSAPPRRDTARATLWVVGSVLALAAALVLGILVGPAGTSNWSIIWNIRAPRVVLAALVGSTLSLAGASYQGVFRNPLVDPYLLGVAAGAGLGATVVFTVGRNVSESWIIDPLPLAAFVGGLAAVVVTYVVGSAFGPERASTTLVLAGVAVTSLTTAIQTFLLQRNTDVVRQVYSWILGRLNTATWGDGA
jgi:iron complex transport system permease protein